jgi:hypothetical protein
MSWRQRGRAAPGGERWCRAVPPVAGARHLLADGPVADAERFGNAALGPAFRLEMPGSETSDRFPVGWCALHAWPCITRTE